MLLELIQRVDLLWSRRGSPAWINCKQAPRDRHCCKPTGALSLDQQQHTGTRQAHHSAWGKPEEGFSLSAPINHAIYSCLSLGIKSRAHMCPVPLLNLLTLVYCRVPPREERGSQEAGAGEWRWFKCSHQRRAYIYLSLNGLNQRKSPEFHLAIYGNLNTWQKCH